MNVDEIVKRIKSMDYDWVDLYTACDDKIEVSVNKYIDDDHNTELDSWFVSDEVFDIDELYDMLIANDINVEDVYY